MTLPKAKVLHNNVMAEFVCKEQRDADDDHYQAAAKEAIEQAIIEERKRIGEWLERADADMNFQDVIDNLKSGKLPEDL